MANEASGINRKGIYQAFDSDGYVIADERWRIKSTLDGGVRIDTDTVRIAPFAETRNESVSLELTPMLHPRRLIIHALSGRRESRVDFFHQRVDSCWRIDDLSQNREYTWAEDCEIGYNSALFDMATLWRRGRQQNMSASVKVLQLDAVSFEPSWQFSKITRVGDEKHETRFGSLMLTHFQIDKIGTENVSVNAAHLWCDQTGVVFDFVASNGSGYKLVAVNFTV